MWDGGNSPGWSYLNHSMDVHKERSGGDDFVLMQYTGLKDKNSNEIYEGDVLQMDYEEPTYDTGIVMVVGPVCYNDCAAFVVRKGFDFMITSKNHLYTVLGNIYENPELLKP